MTTPLFSTGECVMVHAAGDRSLQRRVVRDLGDIVMICKDTEFEKAKAHGVEPTCMAFRKRDVRAAESSASARK